MYVIRRRTIQLVDLTVSCMYVHVSVKGILVKALGTRNSLVSYKECTVFDQFYFQKQESNDGKVNAFYSTPFKQSNNSYFNENDIPFNEHFPSFENSDYGFFPKEHRTS